LQYKKADRKNDYRNVTKFVMKGGKILNRTINAIMIDPVDDVATAIVDFQKGDVGKYERNGEIIEVVLIENIPQFHKFAVRDIANHEVVRKYGEVIGVATRDSNKGSHIHEHNIASLG
jgi:altronate dehydratase small subunit